MIRLLIADDHPVVREGLKRILRDCPDMDLVGEAASGDEVFEGCREHAPDVLVLDISMPGPGFLPTLRRLRTEHPEIPVLVLSVQPEENYALRAIRAGASGYLTKERSPEELERAIRRIHAGGRYVTESLAEHLASLLGDGRGGAPHETLSDREYQILCLLGAGKTVGDIAEELSLSPKTISTYRTRILDKMRLGSNAEIVRYAIENDLA